MSFKKVWKKVKDKVIKPIVGAVVASVALFINPTGTLLNLYNYRKTKRYLNDAKKYKLPQTTASALTLAAEGTTLKGEWLAGGQQYNACFAGGQLFNPSGLTAPLSIAFDTENPHESEPKWTTQINAPYETLAGGSNFLGSIGQGSDWQRFVNKYL